MEGLQVCACTLILGLIQLSNGETLEQYIQNLEKRYEARFQALEEKFSVDLTAMKAEFDMKEEEYISRIEALESAIGTSSDSAETSVRDSTTTRNEVLESIIGTSCDSVKTKTQDSTANATNLTTVVSNADNVEDKPKRSESGSKITQSKTGVKRQTFTDKNEDKNEKIAFFASIDKEVRNIGENQVIAFEKVVTNLGSAYDRNHGTFIAPATGTYVIFGTLYYEGSNGFGNLMVNDEIIAVIKTHSLDNGSQAVIVTLNKGDRVSLQNGYARAVLYGGLYSTFGGFLLFANGAAGSYIVGK